MRAFAAQSAVRIRREIELTAEFGIFPIALEMGNILARIIIEKRLKIKL